MQNITVRLEGAGDSMKHLMIFAIGPVQDFIATARRSRDLWYGSWMLSELARIVAKEIAKDPGNKLIFPIDTETASIPNKIVASIEAKDAKLFAEEVEGVVRAYLKKDLAEKTLTSIPLTEKNKELAKRQIDDLLELYWVSVPYENRDYAVVREEAEALLAARKTTRGFKQMIGTNVPKSSLDGSRESVIDEDEYPNNKKDSDAEKARKVRSLYASYNARQGERLSGVDLLKRLGARKDEPDFKSTSHMAAIPFMEKLGAQRTDELVTAIRKLFDDAELNIGEKDDGALLYESRLTAWIPAGDLQNQLRIKFNETLDGAVGKSRPDSYYALLRADGDSMGKIIDAQTEEDKHRELSKALSKFAGKVSFLVNNEKQENRDEKKDNKGLLIYSGGDDVLAYLPIHTVLRCAEELETTFREDLKEFSASKNGETITPTLSIGIVIAHHLDPLSDMLQLARDGEHKAKDEVKGKNGLAITLSKRSGIDRTIVGKFAELHTRLSELTKFFDAKLISGGTAYELQELQRVLSGTNIPPEGIVKEALRIIKHKKESGGDELTKEVKDTFRKWIEKTSLDELTNEMIIAKALADGTEPGMVNEEARK